MHNASCISLNKYYNLLLICMCFIKLIIDSFRKTINFEDDMLYRFFLRYPSIAKTVIQLITKFMSLVYMIVSETPNLQISVSGI